MWSQNMNLWIKTESFESEQSGPGLWARLRALQNLTWNPFGAGALGIASRLRRVQKR